MKILSDYKNGSLHLRFSGELDHHGAKPAMRSIDNIIDEHLPHDCIINLAELTFMDSSGVAVILRTHKRMLEIDGKAWVVNPQGQPLRVLDASGVDRVIKVYTNAKKEGEKND